MEILRNIVSVIIKRNTKAKRNTSRLVQKRERYLGSKHPSQKSKDIHPKHKNHVCCLPIVWPRSCCSLALKTMINISKSGPEIVETIEQCRFIYLPIQQDSIGRQFCDVTRSTTTINWALLVMKCDEDFKAFVFFVFLARISVESSPSTSDYIRREFEIF